MNQILLILDGSLSKYFLERLCLEKKYDYLFDVIYYNDDTKNLKLQSDNIRIHKFDPTSLAKLERLLLSNSYTQAFIHMQSEFDTKGAYDNLRELSPDLNIVLVDFWGLSINDDKCDILDIRSYLSEYLLSFLPDVPNLAHNIGLSSGEIMEVKVPSYSIFAYRHISSISQKKYKIALIYRNKRIIIPSPSTMIIPNDNLLLVGEPSVLQGVYHNIKGGTGQFPSPFGNNLYLLLDMALCSEEELLKAYNTALLLQNKTSSKKLFIHVINVRLCRLYDELKSNSKAFVTVHFDYKNTSTKNIKTMLVNDDLGLIIIDAKNFKRRKKDLFRLKIPVLKMGECAFDELKEAVILDSNENELENQANLMIDLSKQLQLQALLYHYEPENDSKRLIEHINSLSKLYNKELQIINDKSKNPIVELSHKEAMLQFIYFKKDLLNFSLQSIFSMDLNTLYYKLNKNYQFFIPIS